jgi:hypothetical protein
LRFVVADSITFLALYFDAREGWGRVTFAGAGRRLGGMMSNGRNDGREV